MKAGMLLAKRCLNELKLRKKNNYKYNLKLSLKNIQRFYFTHKHTPMESEKKESEDKKIEEIKEEKAEEIKKEAEEVKESVSEEDGPEEQTIITRAKAGAGEEESKILKSEAIPESTTDWKEYLKQTPLTAIPQTRSLT